MGNRRTWSVLLIVALTALAAVLSYLALTGTADGEHDGFPVQDQAPQTEPTAEPTPAAVEEDETRLLTASGTTALRAEAGSCAEPGTLEISFSGGQEWMPVGSPADAGATEILRLLTVDGPLLEVVALDEDCTPHIYSTNNQGESWAGPLPVDGTWYFHDGNPSEIGAPEGTRSLPCEGTQMAAAGARAAVLCGDGTLTVSGDRGLTWESPEVDGVRAVAVTGTSFVVARDGGDTCDGVRVGALGQPDPGCYPLDDPATPLAVARSGDTTYIWAGDTVATSTDGGATWS